MKKKCKKISNHILIVSIIAIIMHLSLKKGISQMNENNFKRKKMNLKTELYLHEIFKEFAGDELIDFHLHLLGLDEKKTGCYVNPGMKSIFQPVQYLKYNFYLKAGGIQSKKNPDDEYIKRLVSLARHTQFFVKTKYHLFAFDKFYNINGEQDLSRTRFYVSNDYMYSIAKKYPDIFIPVISINPYRKDALDALDKWAAAGVSYIKWLPNAMGINPSDNRIDNFYIKMREHKMILITHTGKEDAVNCGEYQKLGNPLLLRKPLEMGVKVIAAHCASSGRNLDFENPDNKQTDNFDLLLRLLRETKYENLLFADISALTQFNRMGKPLNTILDNDNLHRRLVNGSDYPLPAINMIIQTKKLRRNNFITDDERRILNEIYKCNPLLFDTVLKIILKHPASGKKFNKKIFTGENLLSSGV